MVRPAAAAADGLPPSATPWPAGASTPAPGKCRPRTKPRPHSTPVPATPSPPRPSRPERCIARRRCPAPCPPRGRTMLGAEPLMSARGYPNLFATEETADAAPLWTVSIRTICSWNSPRTWMWTWPRLGCPTPPPFLYGGPVSEPALGPSAFMHRASARLNSEAPITQDWFDFGAHHLWRGHRRAGGGTPGSSRPRPSAGRSLARIAGTSRSRASTAGLGRYPKSGAAAEPRSAGGARGAFIPARARRAPPPACSMRAAATSRAGGSPRWPRSRPRTACPGETLAAWLGEVNWGITPSAHRLR